MQCIDMSHVASSVCVCVCVFGTHVSCTNTAELIDMSFGWQTRLYREPKEPYIRWVSYLPPPLEWVILWELPEVKSGWVQRWMQLQRCCAQVSGDRFVQTSSFVTSNDSLYYYFAVICCSHGHIAAERFDKCVCSLSVWVAQAVCRCVFLCCHVGRVKLHAARKSKHLLLNTT